jgi:glycosidase
MKRWIAALTALIFFASCNNNKVGNNDSALINDTAKIDGHPAWIMQGNIYEVNVRQYTPEGTFKAFAKSLQRLKDMGVQTLWFMPVNPISKLDRKGVLGSYYAVSDYKAINPEYGNMDDWKALVKQCHDMGFKVIIDWVPNHTGADNVWIKSHPDFYVHDSIGKIASQFDWTDTRKLNYSNPAMCDSMISDMKFWIDSTGIDGFRCDYAVGPTKDFWAKCITTLRQDKNIFMLAEADSVWLHEAGFDATYTWSEFNVMKAIAKGQSAAYALDSALNNLDTSFPKNALKMYFTSNHDENSWNGADYATMPGASHAPFAVLTQTIGRSVPLIYSGQEEPFLDSIRFFYKDTIMFGKYARADFYKTLLNLRKTNAALAANATFKKLKTSNDKAVYVFERDADDHKVIVMLNLSDQPQDFTVASWLDGKTYVDAFNNQKKIIQNTDKNNLPAWGYAVYSY